MKVPLSIVLILLRGSDKNDKLTKPEKASSSITEMLQRGRVIDTHTVKLENTPFRKILMGTPSIRMVVVSAGISDGTNLVLSEYRVAEMKRKHPWKIDSST